MPIFRIENGNVTQARLVGFETEHQLQRYFEANITALMGLRFIKTEYSTGAVHHGRIDTLAIDQDGTPTIIEYKKRMNANIIPQGLFYLDWLVDHKGDFTVAAQEILGHDIVINWTNPRVILIAEDFTEYDKHAVNRIGANIVLWIYRKYCGDLFFLEPLFVTITRNEPVRLPQPQTGTQPDEQTEGNEVEVFDINYHLQNKPVAIRELFDLLRERIFNIGEAEEITENPAQTYIAYKHGRNFCEVKLYQSQINFWLDIHKNDLSDPQNIARDMTNTGHLGTGFVEIKINRPEEIDYTEWLIRQSYNQTV